MPSAVKYLGKASEKTEALNSGQWSDVAVPAAVTQRSLSLGLAVALAEWHNWPPHHRYALYKTAMSKSQPEAFEQVLRQLRKLVEKS